MIEIEIPKDISNYEPKVFFFLTKRQLIAIAGAAILCIPAYLALNKLIPGDNSLKIFTVIILAAPFIALGFFKPYGMPFEKFALVFLKTTLLAPKERIYKTNNLYEKFAKEIEDEEILNSKQKDLSQNASKKSKKTQKKKSKIKQKQ